MSAPVLKGQQRGLAKELRACVICVTYSKNRQIAYQWEAHKFNSKRVWYLCDCECSNQQMVTGERRTSEIMLRQICRVKGQLQGKEEMWTKPHRMKEIYEKTQVRVWEDHRLYKQVTNS